MRTIWAASLGIFLVLFVGCGGTTSQNRSSQTAQHVAVVVLEGHSYEQVIGNSAMPYLNELASQYGVVPNYFADRQGPLANALAITTGSFHPVSAQNSFDAPINGDNLVRELVKAGETWKAYFQGLPASGYLGGSVYPYSASRNPFLLFTDVASDAAQAANIVPSAQLASDWAAGSLPNFAFIVPDLEHNGKDCPDESNSCTVAERLRSADDWLRHNIGPLVADPQFQSRSNLLILFGDDDPADTSGSGHVAMVAIGKSLGPELAQASYLRPEDMFGIILSQLGMPVARPATVTQSSSAHVSDVRFLPIDCPSCGISSTDQSGSSNPNPVLAPTLNNSQFPTSTPGMTHDVIPDTDGSRSLGSSSRRWQVNATSISTDALNNVIVVDGATYPRTVAGIKAAVDALGGGPGVVLLSPPRNGDGEYGDDGITTIAITGAKQHVMSLGRWTPAIAVAPDRTRPLFTIRSESSGIHFFGSLGGFAIDAMNHRAGFTAIAMTNVSKFLIHDIDMLDGRGGGTVGIDIQGQDFIKLERCNITADRPVLIERNPYNPPNFDFDQVSFDGLELYPGNTNYGISIGPDISVTNFSIHNMDVAGGRGALTWVDHGHPTTSSLMMTVINARHEQGTDPSSYSWYIDRSGASFGAYGITFIDVGAAAEENGFYFRNVQKVTLIDPQSPRKEGTALNADASTYDVHVIAPMFAAHSVISNGSVSNSSTGVDYFPNGGAIRTGAADNSWFYLDVGDLVVRRGDGSIGGSIATTTDHPAHSGALRLAKDQFVAWRADSNASDVRLGIDNKSRLVVNGNEIPTVASADELSNKTLVEPVVRSPKLSDPKFEGLGSASHVICWKTASTLGYCSTKPDESGSCTCR